MKHKIRVRELVTRPPLPLDPPPPPLCLSLIFYIPGKCCEHWNVTLIATGIISQRKPMDKRDGNEVDRHWRGAFRWRNTGEDCASILIVLYLTLAFNNKRQILNLERRELTMYNLQCARPMQKVHSRNTRNKDKLDVPSFRSATGQRSFSYRAVQLWNDLPESLANIESFNVFKNAIKGRALDEFL